MPEPVLFEEMPAAGSKPGKSGTPGAIGRVTLNAEASLNSLTLEMVDLLQARLDRWAGDGNIVAVFIEGAGKAFCAGGDVRALHASSTGTPGGPCEYAETFFAREYRMNHTLHTYPKPIVCWGHGVVMGGGLGIMAGCSQRVVTETTRIAMPEVTIALFPDVGGSWFLNRMPGRAGEFLALTGASINASDAIYTGIADCFVADEHKQGVIDALLAADWSVGDVGDGETGGAVGGAAGGSVGGVVGGSVGGIVGGIVGGAAEKNHATARRVLRGFAERSAAARPPAQVEPRMAAIAALCDGGSVHEIIDNIISNANQAAAQDADDRWLAKARDGLASGSKLAARWIHHQLRRTRHASLREVFQAEVVLATNIMRHPEFGEGVRALLIDRDRKPAWCYQNSRDVPDEVVAGFFVPPWPDNPLADL